MADNRLHEVMEVLAAADPRHGNHRQALERIQHLQQSADFFSCCATIFASQQMAPALRMQAGFQLKNNVNNPACIANPAVRDHVLQGIADSDASIRKTSCAVISAAVRNGALQVTYAVPQIVSTLQAAGFSNPAAAHGCVLALSQVVEDAVQLIEAHHLSGAVVQALCPCLMYENNDKIRLNALIAMSVFLEQAGVERDGVSAAALRPNMQPLIECFFQNLQNPMSTDISEKAIKCLVLSLTFHDLIDEALFVRMAQVMLQATQVDPDSMETVRIEATEFWRAVLYFPSFAEYVFPAMGSIVPLLVGGMVYSKMELGMLQANARDASVPDRAEDIKPRHYEARTQSTADDDEDDDDDEVEEWNLRRVCALTLDDIAEYFGDRILDSVLVVIDQRMQPSQDWRNLEAAILALGAIAEGCFEGLRPYLDAITTRLLDLLENPTTHFLVVNIATWAVRRVAQYILFDADSHGNLVKLNRYVHCVLGHMKSESKLVQEAACSALTDICGQADDGQLDAFLVPIAQTVNICLQNYQLKNRILLFEQIEGLCQRFGSRMSEGEVLNLFVAPLVAIWQQTANDSPLLFSVFTYMSAVCTAIGAHIQPMAKEIFDRAFGIYHHHMAARQAALATGEDPPEYEFIVTSVDLISGLFDALGSSLEPLVDANQPVFMQLTLAAVVDPLHDIRQSGFALFGDLAKSSPRFVQQCLSQYIQAIIQNCQSVDDVTSGCISNAAWSVQQLLTHQIDIAGLPVLDMQSLPELFAQFTKVLVKGDLTADMKNMTENICLLIGNIIHAEQGVLQATGIAVEQFIRRWLEYARNIKKVESRENAARGVLLLLQNQAACLRPMLPLFFDYANSLSDCPVDIKKATTQILTVLKTNCPQEWHHATASYSPQLMQKLYVTYAVR